MTTNPEGGSENLPATVPLYILAGGDSRRFGSDKARALRDGVPLLVGVARRLHPIASRITVVAARAGAYDDLGFRTIGDVVPRKGPLGGLLAAIEDCGRDQWLFLAACDWVGIRASWARRLLDHRAESTQAIAYKSDRYEPLFALYHTSLRDAVAARIEADRLEMRDLFSEAVTVNLHPPRGWDDALNVNRPPA
jgi:molybdopterin-guanine dinucleotide biosynthesis protein A